MFFKFFLLALLLQNSIFAIIFPPDSSILQLVQEFNDWRDLREQFWNLTDHKFGWSNFACDVNRQLNPPDNVHQLTPGDIDILAVLGDSLSVGEAALSTTFSELIQNYPGVNFASGSDVRLDQQATLFNIFHRFNKQLRGGSSSHLDNFNDFNLAVAGQTSNHLLNQTSQLITRLRSRLTHDDFQNTWKFINIFIGHNDLCKICTNSSEYSFGASIRQSLTLLTTNIPRIFVNIMPPINVYIHRVLHEKSKFCQRITRKSCPCIFQQNSSEYDMIKGRYDEELAEIVRNLERNDTFEVVVSPAMDLTEIPRLEKEKSPNFAFLALDCFHFSTISHDIAAKQIWKGLFQYINHKESTDFEKTDFGVVKCPPKQCPFLRTPRNSLNCEIVSKRSFVIEGGSVESSGVSMLFVVAIFIVGTILILLITRHTSTTFDEERRHLVPPPPIARHDLNDNIF